MTTKVWIGNAHPIPDVWTLTPANVEPGDTFTVEINNKQVSYTVLTTDTYNATTGWVTAAVDGLVTALAASTIAEFLEITWTAGEDANGNSTHVIGTGPDDGTPVTVTTATADAGNFAVTVTTITAGAAAVNEKQQVSLPGTPTGGTFTLTFDGQTTGAIAYNAAAATVTTALEALSNIAIGDVVTTGSAGGPWTVEFTTAYAGVNVPLMTGSGASLTGVATITIATTTQGAATTNEIQRITMVTGPIEVRVNLPGGATADVQYFGDETTAAQLQGFFDDAIGAGNSLVTLVSTAVWDVEFTGAYAGLAMATMSLMSGSATITEVQASSSAGTDEIQTVTINGSPTGGTFTLTFSGATTAGIAYNAAAATVEAALELLGTINDVTVTKSGWVYTVTFVDPGDQDIAQMTASAASLTGGGVYVSTTQAASAAVNEVQQVELDNNPTGGTFTLTFNPGGGGETTGNIAYNASAATVQTALEALATPVPGDVSVSGTAGGPWLVTFTGAFAGTNVAAMTGDATLLTGGGGQTFVAANATVGTGPNWFNNLDNWTGGVAPADDDDLVYENSDIDCKFGLSSVSVTPQSVTVKASYTGDIGLAQHNGSYYEYRTTELTIGSNGDGTNPILTIDIGQGEGTGSPLIRLNTGTKKTAFTQSNAGSSSETNAPAVTWRGTHVDNTVELFKGSLGIAFFTSQTATVATLTEGWIDSQDSDSELTIGSGVTLGTVVKSGGVLLCFAGATSLRNDAGVSYVYGSGNVNQVYVHGGTLYANTSGTLGTKGTITAITAANPAVVTSATHGLSSGDRVRIAGVAGMTQINQQESAIERVDANSFQLVEINSTAYTAYSAAGTWGKLGSVVVSREGTLDFSQDMTAREVSVAIDVYGDAAEVVDQAKRVTTSTYLTGEFAVHWHYTSRNANLGVDFIEVRREP